MIFSIPESPFSLKISAELAKPWALNTRYTVDTFKLQVRLQSTLAGTTINNF